MARTRPNTPLTDAAHAADLLGEAAAAFDAAWDANFAATSDARDAVTAARAAKAAAQNATRFCPDCEKVICQLHGDAIDTAKSVLAAADAAHADSVLAFKAGVTVAQVEALLK